MRKKSAQLSFSPALPCVDCHEPTTRGLIYPMSSQVWQLLPLCDEHSKEPSGSDEPVAFCVLRYRIDRQLAAIQHIRRRRQRLARAYLRLRKQHAYHKAQRALRIGLKRASRWQTQAREGGLA
jgi:hypothetical protein